jgi:hypothetical protein
MKIFIQAIKFLSLLLIVLVFSSCGAKQSNPEQVYADQVIKSDMVWSGRITVRGVVVVGRSATLTIKPGTTVLFEKIDSNDDGIGDSEIRVLGRLLARGTYDNPILFQSAAADPHRKDWSYILFFTSGRENVVEHCVIKHGFSGLQAHFSTVNIANVTFQDNHEGLRFGRAKLNIKNNRFVDNDIGIRFTRMEGPVSITFNEIRDNRIGVFLVPSGQNIQDFFEPDRSGKPWNTGRLLIKYNNISDNSWYNVSLGEKQFWDLDMSENWWGTSDLLKIRQTVFDKRRDAALGSVILEPLAPHAIAEAGPQPEN